VGTDDQVAQLDSIQVSAEDVPSCFVPHSSPRSAVCTLFRFDYLSTK
jgi:hypothetical protein